MPALPGGTCKLTRIKIICYLNMSPRGRIIIAALLAVICSTLEPSRAATQSRVLIGAYDPAHINGLTLIGGEGNQFGLRVLVYRQGSAVEEAPGDFRLGPHAADGSFASLTWKSKPGEGTEVSLRWGRSGGNAVLGQIRASAGVRVALEVYRPFPDDTTAWSSFQAQADRRTILGDRVHGLKGEVTGRRFFLRTERTANGAGNFTDRDRMLGQLISEGHVQQTGEPGGGFNRFSALSFDLTQDQSIGFIAMAGDDFEIMEREAAGLMSKPIAALLDEKAPPKEGTTTGAKAYHDLISRAVNWNRFYDPQKHLEYVAFTRLPGTAREAKADLRWDAFFAALMAGLIDPSAAAGTIRTLLERQLPDGRVPLRMHGSGNAGEPSVLAGRSMPPIGAYCAWKVYLATNDLSLLAWAYPKLLQWNYWWQNNRGDGVAWRDGNRDGLIEYGYDAELEVGRAGAAKMSATAKIRMAISESGFEERPQWFDGNDLEPGAPDQSAPRFKFNDRTHTIEISPIGLNALYALDTEILVLIARELGLPTESEVMQVRYDKIKSSINQELWSEDDGLYLSRFWNGKFFRRVSIESFLPLLAGIPDQDRANILIKKLTEDGAFWGKYPVTTIPRHDQAFTGDSPGNGAVWAVTNSLLYAALRRYGFNDKAAEIARHGARMAKTAWDDRGILADRFSGKDGRPLEISSARYEALFPALILQPAVDELIYVDPWAGLTFGSTETTDETRLDEAPYAGAAFDIIADPKRLVIMRRGKIEVECEGPVRLRGYKTSDRTIGFIIETRERVRLLLPGVEGRKITVTIDDKVLGSTSPGASASFRVPEGVHKVFIVK